MGRVCVLCHYHRREPFHPIKYVHPRNSQVLQVYAVVSVDGLSISNSSRKITANSYFYLLTLDTLFRFRHARLNPSASRSWN